MGRIITPEVQIVDSSGRDVMDISMFLTGGRVEMNTDRSAGKMAASLSFSDGDLIRPYVDYLRVGLRIEFDDGQPTITKPLGVYSTRTAPATRTRERHEATYDVEDLTRLLSFSAYTAVDNVASGTNVITEVVATLGEANISLYSFPSTTKTTPKALTYPIGTTRLEKINDLLGSIGWYELYPGLDGRLTSKPYVNLAEEEPVAYVTDFDTLAPIAMQSNDQSLVNVVLVVRDDPAAAPLSAIARNDDPASPTSTVSVGFEYMRVERVADLQTQTEVDALAARLLREARTYYQTATVNVWPDVAYGTHEVVDLLMGGELEVLNGRWWVRRWAIGLTPVDCYYELEINRVTDTVNGVTL